MKMIQMSRGVVRQTPALVLPLFPPPPHHNKHTLATGHPSDWSHGLHLYVINTQPFIFLTTPLWLSNASLPLSLIEILSHHCKSPERMMFEFVLLLEMGISWRSFVCFSNGVAVISTGLVPFYERQNQHITLTGPCRPRGVTPLKGRWEGRVVFIVNVIWFFVEYLFVFNIKVLPNLYWSKIIANISKQLISKVLIVVIDSGRF